MITFLKGGKEKGVEESDPKPYGKLNAPKKPGNALMFVYEELLKKKKKILNDIWIRLHSPAGNL